MACVCVWMTSKHVWKYNLEFGDVEESLMSDMLYLVLIKNDVTDFNKDLITMTKERLFYKVPFFEVKEQNCPPILEDILNVSKVTCPTILLLRGWQLVNHYPYHTATAARLSSFVSSHMFTTSEYVLEDVLGLGAAEKSPSGNSTSSSEDEKNRERGFHLESPKREEHDKES
ncbi:uncharacterized protein LOC127745808 isoform X2 [Arachis duranensis]|uniref:Uncharacterized protein LOC127745808 isoform X2 n=1 Tax=Arachis duranensis TaxID=130453 RepID=A0A9C6WSL8_ARADU|nr:uncharacterized protein LOC127745808 isoform X2 [Arachis duranensis]